MGEKSAKESEMIGEIMEEIRHIRTRLDAHISDEAKSFDQIHRDLSKIREDVAVNKTRLGVITSGIAVVVATVVTFFVDLIRK